jgi:ribonucleotide reductase beta subunit family protein with ferritin-like domain
MEETLYEPQDRDEFKFCVGLGQILLGEGQGLFAAFMVLLNYKRQGIIMGFNDVNQWSLTDEQEHVQNNIRILAVARQDLTEVENERLDRILRATARKYKEAELHLLDLIYTHGEPEDLTKEDGYEYMEFLEDLRLNELGLKGYVRPNPLEWMDWMLSGARHDNFFEKKVTDYSHTGLPGDVDYTRYLHLVVDTKL